jgi:toxin ParE1/3/4
LRIRWTLKAQGQIENIESYIAGDNPRAATGVIIDIISSAEQLLHFPNSGRPGRRHGTRELVLAGTPYILVYRIKGMEIQIVNVIHCSMKRIN